jgi:hypothetical protein
MFNATALPFPTKLQRDAMRFRFMEESEGFARELISRGALAPTTNDFFP